uniref:Kinesin motor domain-containing protein n=1 Tax=Heterorhabditis bacteriophora TaxID=37862 RepID=A0A1I7XFF9_HETBA
MSHQQSVRRTGPLSSCMPVNLNRSNIPTPVRTSSEVKAARNLKRQSINNLNKTSAIPTKKAISAHASFCLNRGLKSDVTRPLPSSRTTGRATMATPGYLGPTGTSASRGRTTSAASSTIPQCVSTRKSSSVGVFYIQFLHLISVYTTHFKYIKIIHIALVRRSSSLPRESDEILALRGRTMQLETELHMAQTSLGQQDKMYQQMINNLNETIVKNNMEIVNMKMDLDNEKRKLIAVQEAFDAERHRMQNDLNNLDSELLNTRDKLNSTEHNLQKKINELREKDNHMRELHNTVVDLKGKSSAIYEFQRVFGPNVNQCRVFNEIEELILSCLHGYNVSIIAYGQTGSGKTHTMIGGEGDAAGIIPRAIEFLFKSKDELADLDWSYEFSASFLEVYNEEVYDLLGERKKLDIKMGSGCASVAGLSYKDIACAEDIETVLLIADRNRSVATTKCNEQSSRSHAVFELRIKANNRITGTVSSHYLHFYIQYFKMSLTKIGSAKKQEQ